MRLALPLMTLFSPLAFAALVSRFDAMRTKSPPLARMSGATLPMRVRVALQAAARARR